MSVASSGNGIHHGSVSLESSISGHVEDEAIAAKTEELTDEIMQLLVAEMRLDFDYMVSRRDSRA